MINVAIINQSTVLKDEQLTPICEALQRQVSEHFFPFWSVNCHVIQVCKKPDPKKPLRSDQFVTVEGAAGAVGMGVAPYVPQVAVPPAKSWWLVIANTSDFAGAAGYHDVTPEGMPLGKAFVKADIEAKRPWTTTVSHELLEMLADPDISRCVEVRVGRRLFYALEVCDPCQDDRYSYMIGQVAVSDFVLPGYYHDFRNYPFYDYAKHIRRPRTILPGGYQSILDPASGEGWRDSGPPGQKPTGPAARRRVGSRRERRSVGRENWEPTNLPFNFLCCDGCGCQVQVPKDGSLTTVIAARCEHCLAAKETK